MRIWIDLANSPHVPFFKSLAAEFTARNHDVVVTARDFAETVPLAEAAGFQFETIGGHGGGALSGKAGNLVQRAMALARWARGKNLELAVSHNSYSQILAARALSLSSVTLMDYEHQPANHLAFRFASRIIVPESFPSEALRRFGANEAKIRRYSGIKEEVYLTGFQPDPLFANQLTELGISAAEVLVTVRPPADEALYHRFENELFEHLVNLLVAATNAKVILLPRSDEQRRRYANRFEDKLIVPLRPLDGPNLIAHSDLVVSAGGTMNREAVALGVPAASIYAGAWAAVDEALVRDGRLQRISTMQDIEQLRIEKKRPSAVSRGNNVKQQVVDLILE